MNDMKTNYKTVNEKGIEEIRQFLAENHKLGDSFSDHMLFKWADDAEYQMSIGNPPAIEIKSHSSIYGRVQEYTISDAGIDIEYCEE